MVVELYPRSSHDAFHGVQVQFPPHVDEAVQQIVSATKGFGTDEKALISVLGSKSPETRTLIAMRYEQLHRKPLKDLMKSEASGDFGRLLRMIAAPLHETEAQLLRDATKGAGTNESQVVQIISGRTNEEMDILKKTYFRLFNKDLAVTLNSELGGDFRKVIMAMLQSQQVPYNPAFHTAAKAEEEAIKLYKAGQGRLGTKEEEFIGILVAAPSEFLRLMDAAYVRKYSNNIAKAVDKEFSGDAKKALQYLVKSVMDPFPTIAEVFEKTMKGFGTDETGLSTALVRYHCVLPKVKEAYKKLYGKELRDRIHGEISGDYRQLALQLYDAPQDPPPSAAAKAPAGAPTGAPAPGAPMPGAPAPGAQQHGYAAPYGQAPGAPAPGAAPTGYPPQGQQPHGYPPQGQPGYPPQQPPAGYPPQQPPAGYPPHQAAPGYPPQQQHAPAPGYPPQQQQPYGYPPQGQQPHGYPPQGQPGYPPQGQPGYPPQQGHYPPQGQPGYPPQGQPGYPPQQGFAQPGYPPQGQPGYPPQQGFAQPGYPPQGQPGYPPQGQPGYPPHGY